MTTVCLFTIFGTTLESFQIQNVSKKLTKYETICWEYFGNWTDLSNLLVLLSIELKIINAFPNQAQQHQHIYKICKNASSILCLQTQSWMFIIIVGNEKGCVVGHSQAETAAIQEVFIYHAAPLSTALKESIIGIICILNPANLLTGFRACLVFVAFARSSLLPVATKKREIHGLYEEIEKTYFSCPTASY